MSVCPDELKLVALDRDDIEVVSAHVQDALVRIGDIWWQPRDHRFVVLRPEIERQTRFA